MVFCYQVTASSDPPPSAAADSGEGIVGALMMVMQKRSKVIHSSGNQLFTIFYFIKLHVSYSILAANMH